MSAEELRLILAQIKRVIRRLEKYEALIQSNHRFRLVRPFVGCAVVDIKSALRKLEESQDLIGRG